MNERREERIGEERETSKWGTHPKTCIFKDKSTYLYKRYDSKMSIQSLTTPAIFIVNALVLPISRNTAMLSPNAAPALDKKINGSITTLGSFHILGASMNANGTRRKAKQQGAI